VILELYSNHPDKVALLVSGKIAKGPIDTYIERYDFGILHDKIKRFWVHTIFIYVISIYFPRHPFV
jgi:hypothetical protein